MKAGVSCHGHADENAQDCKKGGGFGLAKGGGFRQEFTENNIKHRAGGKTEGGHQRVRPHRTQTISQRGS